MIMNGTTKKTTTNTKTRARRIWEWLELLIWIGPVILAACIGFACAIVVFTLESLCHKAMGVRR